MNALVIKASYSNVRQKYNQMISVIFLLNYIFLLQSNIPNPTLVAITTDKILHLDSGHLQTRRIGR